MAVYLSKEFTVDEAYDEIKAKLKNPKIENIVKNTNSIDIFTSWSKFTFIISGNTLNVKHNWNSSKMAIIIVFIVLGLFFWLLLIAPAVLGYLEYNIKKDIQGEIVNILNNKK